MTEAKEIQPIFYTLTEAVTNNDLSAQEILKLVKQDKIRINVEDLKNEIDQSNDLTLNPKVERRRRQNREAQRAYRKRHYINPSLNPKIKEGYITVSMASELLGYSKSYVRDLIHIGEIKAERFGRVWGIKRQSIEVLERTKR